jgi:acyl carrier protein
MQMGMVTEGHVRLEIRKLLAEITEREPAEIADTDRFAEDLSVDSLMAMEMMVTVDKRFKIDIPEEEFTQVKNVNDAVAAVMRHLPKSTD